MKSLAIAMTMIAVATLPAAAMELQMSQRPLTEYVSAATDAHIGDRFEASSEVSRGRAFDHGGKLFGVSCVGAYIGGWTEGYPGTQNAC
jgi:hypothetical protein